MEHGLSPHHARFMLTSTKIPNVWPGRGRVVDVAYPKKRRLRLGESQDSTSNHLH